MLTKGNGFYIALEQVPIYGLGISLVYIKENKDIQLSIHILDMTLAIGYEF